MFTEVRKGVERESGEREVPFGADLLSQDYILTPINPKMPLERVRGLKPGKVHLATLSPDGRMVAFIGDDGAVQLWSMVNGELIGSLMGPEKAALSPIQPRFEAAGRRKREGSVGLGCSNEESSQARRQRNEYRSFIVLQIRRKVSCVIEHRQKAPRLEH